MLKPADSAVFFMCGCAKTALLLHQKLFPQIFQTSVGYFLPCRLIYCTERRWGNADYKSDEGGDD